MGSNNENSELKLNDELIKIIKQYADLVKDANGNKYTIPFDYNLSTVPLCLVNYIPAFLALVQLILIRIFVPVVPADLINKSEFDELKKFFLTLYSE